MSQTMLLIVLYILQICVCEGRKKGAKEAPAKVAPASIERRGRTEEAGVS